MHQKKLWIWQHAEYPNFIYQKENIEKIILATTKEQGVLEGEIKHLTQDATTSFKLETALNEIMYTSSMEGEMLQRSSVRSSLRKQFEKFDDKQSTKHTDSIASVQKDANKNHKPLSIERLHQWHFALMQNGEHDNTQVTAGAFRKYDEMYVTSGSGFRTKVHYQALPHKEINDAMDRFIAYCSNAEDNPFIKSAIAHIWFVQIHPYGDGNGRIARSITNYILAKELGLDSRFFSLSLAINNDLTTYSHILETSNKLIKNPHLELTAWIEWHTTIIYKAIELSIQHIDNTIEKTKFYDKIRDIKINVNQSKAINMLIGRKEPMINNSMYRAITGSSQVTASRQLNDLVKKGVLKKVEGQKGRSTVYELYL
jgi:Fic family protein